MNLMLNPVPENCRKNAGAPEDVDLVGVAGVKAELFGGEGYGYQELALLTG